MMDLSFRIFLQQMLRDHSDIKWLKNIHNDIRFKIKFMLIQYYSLTMKIHYRQLIYILYENNVNS